MHLTPQGHANWLTDHCATEATLEFASLSPLVDGQPYTILETTPHTPDHPGLVLLGVLHSEEERESLTGQEAPVVFGRRGDVWSARG